jgi:hypothetical protein
MRQHPEYTKLPTAQRAQYVWENGTYLLGRCKDRYVVTLHALEDRFVEIWLDGIRQRVEKVITFRSTDRLEPFLERIFLADSLDN